MEATVRQMQSIRAEMKASFEYEFHNRPIEPWAGAIFDRFAKPLTPRLSGDIENVTDNVTDELTERQRLIVKLIPFNDTDDVTETTTSLAQKTGVSRRTIARDMDILKEKGYVVRIGPDNGGYWKRLK